MDHSLKNIQHSVQHPAHLNGWVGLGGVAAFLSRYAAGWTSLTFIPEPHPPLLWLLNDVYKGARCLDWCREEEECDWNISATTDFHESVRQHRNNSLAHWSVEMFAVIISNGSFPGNCFLPGLSWVRPHPYAPVEDRKQEEKVNIQSNE